MSWTTCGARGNDVVVHILNARTSNLPSLMQLLRSLLLAAARHSSLFLLNMCPVLTIRKLMLSRFHWQDFRQLVLDAQLHPTWFPLELLLALTSLP